MVMHHHLIRVDDHFERLAATSMQTLANKEGQGLLSAEPLDDIMGEC